MPGDKKPLAALGFLTVVRHDQHGLFGGYLVLNANGRPLEFHCTAPVKPSRAQEILFGPTLEPYLYGEQIGQTLVAKGQVQPLVVCTDLPSVLALREHIHLPLALVIADGAEAATGSTLPQYRLDGPHLAFQPAAPFQLGRNRLAVATRFASDQQIIAERLAPLAAQLDLAEPFIRIRGAIDEAQRSAR